MTLSLELSKRLHELGVVVESECVWGMPKYSQTGEFGHKVHPRMLEFQLHGELLPAPDFEELWKVMPSELETQFNRLTMDKYNYATVISYPKRSDSEFEHESPTEALGMLLIWLAENGHVEVKSCATR